MLRSRIVVISPLSGVSFPESMLRRVVLPAPLRAIRAIFSSLLMTRDISLKTDRLPYDLLIFSA